MSIRRAFGDDYRTASWTQRIALVAMGAWFVYEWGPGNETVTPFVLVRVLGSRTGADAIVTTGVVGFVVTLVQQLASGGTALVALRMFDRTRLAAWDRLSKTRQPRPWGAMSLGARAAVAFGLGTTAVALTEMVAARSATAADRRRVVVQSAMLCALLVGGLGAAGGAVAALGRRRPEWADTTATILRVAGSPLLWLAVGFAAIAWQWRGANRSPDATQSGSLSGPHDPDLSASE